MRTFDYETAWKEVAHPAFLAISPAAVAALEVVKTEARDMHQNSALDMDWTPALQAAFEPIPNEELARASRAVYFAGHWHPGKANGAVPRDGSTWKFSLYADQLLSKRLGLPRGLSNGTGTSYRVINGALRVGWSTPHSWQWEEIDYAGAELLSSLQEDSDRPTISAKRHTNTEWFAWTDRMEKWAAGRKSSDPFFSTDRFMIEESARGGQ